MTVSITYRKLSIIARSFANLLIWFDRLVERGTYDLFLYFYYLLIIFLNLPIICYHGYPSTAIVFKNNAYFCILIVIIQRPTNNILAKPYLLFTYFDTFLRSGAFYSVYLLSAHFGAKVWWRRCFLRHAQYFVI